MSEPLIFNSPEALQVLQKDKVLRAREEAKRIDAEARAHGPMRKWRIWIIETRVEVLQAHTEEEALELAYAEWPGYDIDDVEEIV